MTLCHGGRVLPKGISRKSAKDPDHFFGQGGAQGVYRGEVPDRERGTEKYIQFMGFSESLGLTKWCEKPQLYLIGNFLANGEL